jgi:hypothetical protein
MLVIAIYCNFFPMFVCGTEKRFISAKPVCKSNVLYTVKYETSCIITKKVITHIVIADSQKFINISNDG